MIGAIPEHVARESAAFNAARVVQEMQEAIPEPSPPAMCSPTSLAGTEDMEEEDIC